MASSQDSVSCDSCKVNNFKGLRYKCLICYDYDLCSRCHEAGLVSSRHKSSHPMQCFVARNDYDLFYLGEPNITDRPHSYTCPLCNQAGFTETTLTDHVHANHSNTVEGEDSGVVCPICSVESNQLTYDLGMHLTMEHKTNTLRNILARDQQQDSVQPPPLPPAAAIRGRGSRCYSRGSSRGRRSHPSSLLTREPTNDPLVSEIISQLPTARRAAAASNTNNNNNNNSVSTALNQLQMQLQSSPRGSSDREIRIFRRTLQTLSNQMLMNSHQASAAPPPPPLPPGAILTGLPSTSYSSSNYTMMPIINQSIANNNSNNAMGASQYCNPSSTGLVGDMFSPQSVLSNQALYQQQHQQHASQLSTLPMPPHEMPFNPQLTPARFLLPGCLNPNQTEADQAQHESLKADRSLFVQDLLLQFGTIEDEDKSQLI